MKNMSKASDPDKPPAVSPEEIIRRLDEVKAPDYSNEQKKFEPDEGIIEPGNKDGAVE